MGSQNSNTIIKKSINLNFQIDQWIIAPDTIK